LPSIHPINQRKYPKITKLIICIDRKKLVEKKKDNQLQLYPYVIVIFDNEKKSVLDYWKLIEICGGETDDDTNNTSEIVITISEGKNIHWI
jgi:hypothetical protein